MLLMRSGSALWSHVRIPDMILMNGSIYVSRDSSTSSCFLLWHRYKFSRSQNCALLFPRQPILFGRIQRINVANFWLKKFQ